MTKISTQSEYTPGGIITYMITVTNPTDSFMDNVVLVDYLSQITADQIGGSTGAAYDNWDLEIVSATGIGTVSGTSGLTNQSGDLILTTDIGANGSIVYRLKVKVKLTTIGKIIDTISQSNVPEVGSGIKMSSPVLEVSKNVDSSEYTPGGTLTYTIDLENPGDGTAVDVEVKDRLAEIMTELINGNQGPAYDSWTVTAAIYDISSGSPVPATTPNDPTYAGFDGIFSGNQSTNQIFLVDNAILAPDRRIRYTIVANISSEVKGEIKNLVKINDDLSADKASVTRESKIIIAKTATSPYIAGDTITYNITVSNNAVAGVALGVQVSDDFMSIQAQTLAGGTTSVFENWTIKAVTLVGPETTTAIPQSTIDQVFTSGTLSDTVNISPNGHVQYTIEAKVKDPTLSEIVYGGITNTATADGLTATATSTPKLPRLNVRKTAISDVFTLGGEVQFKVTVQNVGDGYADNAIVRDILSTTTYFQSVSSITGTATGLGTTTGITNGMTDDLDTTVDIAPSGVVEYIITAVVDPSYVGDTVSNAITVTDVQHNLTYIASATITDEIEIEGNLIDFTKTSDSITFSSGGTIEYSIDVVNRLDSPRIVRVEDIITGIRATYANDLISDNTVDEPNQPAFSSWTIYRSINGTNTVTIANSVDLNNEVETGIEVEPGGTLTYRIIATVNERVVTSQLTNTAKLYAYDNITGSEREIGTASVQHNRTSPGGGLSRVVDKVRYVPGDAIKYTITVNSTGSAGYQNNVSINELIKNMSVDLIDGGTGNPFVDPVTGEYNFTVRKIATTQTNGTEEDFTQGVEDNENLVGIVDVKQGESVQYEIIGVVRADAIGTINNNGLITEPYRHNLQNTKSVSPTTYQPGQGFTYTITVTNNDLANAKDIVVTDNFGTLTVIDSEGNTVPALTNITLDLDNSSAVGYKAELGNPTIVNGILTATPDIPIGGVITYKVNVIVTEKAVGNILNTAYIDGDAVSNQIGSSPEKKDVKKEIVKYYDKYGTALTGGKYTPGGYIEYKITLKNIGAGILNDKPFIDDLYGVTTAYSDGTTGRAFDSWIITETHTGLSTNPDTLNTVIFNTSTTTGINTVVDIHPAGQIIYTIMAKINEKAVGTIGNTCSLNSFDSSVTSTMESSTMVHTKQAYAADGTTIKTTFLPGETVVYKIRVSNTGLGTSFLQNYEDIIANITAEVAESAGSAATPTESVFASYLAEVTTSGGNVTVVNGFNQTVNPQSVTIEPGGYVEFTITGVLKKTVIGDFINTSKYGSGAELDTKTVTLVKVPTTLEVTKRVTKLAGVDFAVGDTYKPGDSVEYEINITNTGDSFSNNLSIRDNTNTIVAILAGNTTNTKGIALENIVISAATVTNTESEPVLTYIKDNGSTSTDLRVIADLAPKDKITYTITGDIKKSAIGTIPANVVTVGGTNYSSEVIDSKTPLISVNKELVTPVDKIYGPGEEIQYKLTIENTGDGFGNDIEIIDNIGNINTTLLNGTQGKAFSSWTVSQIITHSNSDYDGQTILMGTLVNNENINVKVDIAPSGKVEIIINAKTSIFAAGDITNVAKLNNIDKPSDTISARIATVTFTKLYSSELVTVYSPNSPVNFKIVIENTSTDAIARDINLVDIMNTITTMGSAGVDVPALSEWTITIAKNAASSPPSLGYTDDNAVYTSGIGSGGVNSAANNITAGKISLAPGAKVTVNILGKANYRAMGDITNTASASYNGINLGEESVTFTPTDGYAVITKTANSGTYQPGGQINYTITIANTGIGYLKGVRIVDDFSVIQTQVAGTNIDEGAITSYTVGTITKNTYTEIWDSSNSAKYIATANIYPGTTVIIPITATVNDMAIGTITNIAEIQENDETPIGEDEVSITSTPPILNILKIVDKGVYVSGDTLTYTVRVANTGDGWADGVQVTDSISSIMVSQLGTNGQVQAFESWTITAADETGSLRDSIFETSYTSDEDLDTIVSVAPKSGIDFTIVATLKENTTSDIVNIASAILGGVTKESQVTTPQKSVPVTFIKKQAISDSGSYSYTRGEISYLLGDTVRYEITVENDDSAKDEITVVDEIKNILVNGTNGSSIPAFKNWKIVSVEKTGAIPITAISPDIGTLQEQPSGTNISVVTPLEADESLTIVIEGELNESDMEAGLPQGLIRNTAKVTRGVNTDNSNETILNPYPSIITMSKEITSVAEELYTDDSIYQPGDEVVYTILVENTGDGVADNVVIKDFISNVTVEQPDGTMGRAFSEWTIEVEKSSLVKINGIITDDNDIDITVDFGPEQYIKFIVTATVGNNAVGIISSNILEVNDDETLTNQIPPGIPIPPTLTKSILEGESYIQDGIIKYEIVLTNPNDKLWIKGVHIQDLIGTIDATNLLGNSEFVFKPNWSVTKADLGKGSVFGSIYPSYNANLNATIVLAPLDIVTFTVTATVKSNIVGDIINGVSGTYFNRGSVVAIDSPPDVTSTTEPGFVTIAKTATVATYAPGENIGFDISIENTSITNVVNDVKLTDLISSIMGSQIGSMIPVQAFEDGWTIGYEIVGDAEGVTNVTALPTSGDLDSVNLDIGKSTNVVVKVRGVAQDGVYGDLTNTASFAYDEGVVGNTTGEDTVTINPKNPELVLTKSVETDIYSVSEDILYTIKIENTGEGVAVGVRLEDVIGEIETDLAGEITTGLAFESWIRYSIDVPTTSSLNSEVTTGNTYSANFNIAPSDIIIIILKGTPNSKSYGEIENIANVSYEDTGNNTIEHTDNAIANSEEADLSLIKTVDKATYNDKDILTYTLKLKNEGLGWANDVILGDRISEIEDSLLAESAFESWTISVESTSIESYIVPNSFTDTTDLSVVIDIAPESEITFTIVATLKENVSSGIINSGYYKIDETSEEIPSNEVITNPIAGHIAVSKEAAEDYYIPGETLNYTIKVTNSENVLIRDVLIEDDPNGISITTNLNQSVNPFTSWKIISVIGDKGSIPSSIVPEVGESSTAPVEIQTNLRPEEIITVEIEGVVNRGEAVNGVPIGNLENKAVGTYANTPVYGVEDTPAGDPTLNISKNIKTLAGMPFTDQGYNSGDTVVYEIIVENTGTAMADNVEILDNISSLETELAGGLTGAAFEEWQIVMTKGEDTTVITPATLSDNSDIDIDADIDFGDKVTITITAKINSTAVGTIPVNVITVNGMDVQSSDINPFKGDVSFTKEILEGSEYYQGGTIKYKLAITNPNPTFINDLTFVDAISEIEAENLAGSSVPAFESWTVTRTDNGTGTVYSQEGSLENPSDIDVLMDISPNDVVIYIVEAVVNEDIVGDIINTGIVNYESSTGATTIEKEVTSTAIPGDVTIFKESSVDTYVPGSPIGFDVIVSNVSTTSVANNVLVKDIITDILANKVGGGTTQAFQPGWTIDVRVEGDEVTTNIDNLLALSAGENIDDVSVDIGKDTKIIIEIRGFAESNIYGEIRNTAYFVYSDGNQEGYYDPGIESIPADVTITKTVDKIYYVSGDTLVYTITFENIGDSVTSNFQLSDEIGQITAEVSGVGTTMGPVFASWERVSTTVPPTTSALIQETVIDSTEGDTYSAVFDIGPGDVITVVLSGVTNTDVFGDVINTATGIYTTIENGESVDKTITADATSQGTVGELTLDKEVSNTLYAPDQNVEYMLTVINTGDGWVRNAVLEDLISEVTTTVLGGTQGLAFDSSTLAVSYTTTDNENSITILEDNSDFKAQIDVKNGTSITFILTVKASQLAVSMIENTATLTVPDVDDPLETSVQVYPKPPVLSLTKEVDVSQFDLYQTMIYTITLENTETNVNGIEIQDLLQNIRTVNNLGQQVYPFEDDISITKNIVPESSVIVTPTGSSGNIGDTLDMEVGSKIIYTVTVTVKDGVVGNIENTVTADIPSQGQEAPSTLTDSVESNPNIPTILVNKSVTTSIENDSGVMNGELVTYTIKITTDRPVFNVQLIDEVAEIKNLSDEFIFIPGTIQLNSVEENGVPIPYTGNISGTNSEIKISRIDNEAIITIEAEVSLNVTLISQEEMINTAKANYDQQNSGTYDLDDPVLGTVVIVAQAPQLELTKVSTKDEILLGDEVEYTITVKNVGVGLATNFTIIDNISDIVDESNSGGQIPVYIEWTVTGTAGPSSFIGTLPAPNTNINIADSKIAVGESLVYTVKAKVSLDLKTNEIENTVKITVPGLDDLISTAEVRIKKPIITIDKEAGVKETSIGKFVPYSLVITNNEVQRVKNIYVKDTPPAGFTYIENSLQVVKNGEKVGTIPATYAGDNVIVGPFDLEPREQIEIVYLTRVALGVVRGTYKNVAVVLNSAGMVISNEDMAEVDVVEDPLFETSTVIGKVFHDRDGDGIQDDSRATGIKISQNIPIGSYIPNSTFYVLDEVRRAIPDRSAPLTKGIKLKEILYGRANERERFDKSKVEIYTGLKDISNLGDIRVTTDEGTDITLTKDNKVVTNHKGLKAKGMVSQNIVIKREILKRNTFKNKDNNIEYYQKITILNTGLMEEGFPGVRIANVEGLVIVTDQYGRFHIPEVSDKKGKNYILKVDEASLPVGTIFTTENPKVQRLGTSMLKYNFGVILPKISSKGGRIDE